MKLSKKQAQEIRERLKCGGSSQRELATEYGVCQMTVSNISRCVYIEEQISEEQRFRKYVSMLPGQGPWGDCWEWVAGGSPKGYGHFKLERKNPESRVTVRANRHAWEMSFGPIPDDLIVRHICDNPRCCRIGHLVLGTQSDNLRDARLKGRRPSRSE